MFAIPILLLTVCLPFAIHAAPALNAQTLLQNGQQAQNLNAFFQTLKETDSCTDGDNACVKDALALCSKGQWQLEKCATSQKCFALPSVRDAGAIVTCTSEKTALSLIEATGATGGLAVAKNNSTSSSPPAGQTSSGSGGAKQTDDANDDSVVTVTITLTPGAVLTLDPTTTTLSPAEASALLSSLTSGGQFATVSTIGSPPQVTSPAATLSSSTNSIPVATPPPSDNEASLPGASSNASVISLTAASATPSPSAAVSVDTSGAAAQDTASGDAAYDQGY